MENFYSQCTDMLVELMISSSSRAQSGPDFISSVLVLDTKKTVLFHQKIKLYTCRQY